MFRRILVFAALSAAGCVPVTAPLGDIDKAEPDKSLVGQWTVTAGRGTADQLRVKSITVDALEVKGNPKGLMQAFMKTADAENIEIWFFTATIGKNGYATLIVEPIDSSEFLKFGKEGAFAKWRKAPGKGYFIFRYARDGDRLSLDCGNSDSFSAIMKDAQIKADRSKYPNYYQTPAGWLDKYLDKTGPAKLFDGTNSLSFDKVKQ